MSDTENIGETHLSRVSGFLNVAVHHSLTAKIYFFHPKRLLEAKLNASVLCCSKVLIHVDLFFYFDILQLQTFVYFYLF